MSKKKLDEKVVVKGGENGDQTIPEPTNANATLPKSKDQGDKQPPLRTASDLEAGTPKAGEASADANKATLNMKPSDASPKTVETLNMSLDVAFEGEDLSEEFKEKASTIFEAAVAAKVKGIEKQLEEEQQKHIEETVEAVTKDLHEKVDNYLNYVVEQWMEQNELAVESSLKSEITEEFIDGLKKLFAENYIEVPEDKLDVLGELAQKVEELESKLDESINDNIKLKNNLKEQQKTKLLAQVSESLTVAQKEKFADLAEGVDFVDEESYVKKLNIVKENYFKVDKKGADIVESEVESAEEPEQETKQVLSGPVSSYVKAISRSLKR